MTGVLERLRRRAEESPPAPREEAPPRRQRQKAANAFRYAEQIFYVGVAVALALAGAVLFVYVLVEFVREVFDGSVSRSILAFLDGLLLVFILTELIHTVRAVIDENVLKAEPFLIVGIVAAIRRVIVITGEAKHEVGSPAFRGLMLEMGILTAAVLVLGTTIFLLRHTSRPEPPPAHESEGKA